MKNKFEATSCPNAFSGYQGSDMVSTFIFKSFLSVIEVLI